LNSLFQVEGLWREDWALDAALALAEANLQGLF